MIFIFAFTYQIFPARATPTIEPTESGYFLALLYHMALPLITIVLIGFGSWSYLVRNFMVGIIIVCSNFVSNTMAINRKSFIRLF